jgi:surface antigen
VVGIVAVRSSSHPGNAPGAKAQLLSAPSAHQEAINPLDKLSSADVAVNVARLARLDEAVAVTNKADTVNTQLAVSSADDNVVAKPQIVSTALKSKKDIKKYKVAAGDTISGIATKFGVTSDTIRTSNSLSGEAVTAGQELVISPVNGLVYKIKAGDTPDSISRKYQVNKDQLVAFNDAELTGSFVVGELIVIPNGVEAVAATTTNASRYNGYASYSSGFAFGDSAIYGYNGYARGWCTWYAASRVPVPNNWGNANSWDNGARASGWKVSRVPVVGAVAQTDGMSFAGHVGVVEAVSEDGSMIKYSDMNGISGFNRVGYSDWVPVSTFPNYIYR